jgi:hypothetical protein
MVGPRRLRALASVLPVEKVCLTLDRGGQDRAGLWL